MRTADIDLRPPQARLLLATGGHSQFLFSIRDRATRQKRSLAEWTGWAARWAPDHQTPSTVQFDATLAANNVDVVIAVTTEQVAALSPVGYWELEGVNPDKQTVVLLAGPCETLPDVANEAR